MAIKDRNILKGWFQRGSKPSSGNFADWLDSFWHKNDNIPVSSINNLQNSLDTKAD